MTPIAAAQGIYSVKDAAALTNVSPRQIRGWLEGYRGRRAEPVLRLQHERADGEIALGFFNLLEVDFLGRLIAAAAHRGRPPSWRAIRVAVSTARRHFGTEHPLAMRRAHTDGHTVWYEAQQETGDCALYDLTADNYAIYNMVEKSFLASVAYRDDQPHRWWPRPELQRIVVDPLRSFGRPIEDKSLAPAEALFDAWKAEGRNAHRVAAFFRTDVQGVEEAIHFTLRLPGPLPKAA